nr:DUF2235 domain-containing protein [Chitinivorax sp. B]
MADPLEEDGKLAQRFNVLREAPGRNTPFTIPAVEVLSREQVLRERAEQLRKAITPYLKNKPVIRSVRVSVYGFSRGAAEARAFCNWLLEAYGNGVAGIPLQIDFLGIFDTVASVGIAHSAPGGDGHFAWASEANLRVPPAVRRCVHLASVHEVRGSFPLDSIGSAPNCKEVFYPGVHSDVGGGYPPNDQGRALGEGAVGDARKLSQISLAQMYRESLIAGVPLLPSNELLKIRQADFQVHPDTIKLFNAYIESTRFGRVKAKGPLWLTETQPLKPVSALRGLHYGLFLAWRRSMLGKAHQLPGLKASTAGTHDEDIFDIRQADEELKKEIQFLEDPSKDKFDKVDIDPAMQAYGAVLANSVPLFLGKSVEFLLKKYASIPMRAKQKEWDDYLKRAWYQEVEPNTIPLFEQLMHDSRAWFRVGQYHEPYQMWGYVRYRHIYLPAGDKEPIANEPEDHSEHERKMAEARAQAIEQEKADHQRRMENLRQQKEAINERWKANPRSPNATEVFREADRVNHEQMQRERQRHAQAMAELSKKA